jgi:hypothetical protein
MRNQVLWCTSGNEAHAHAAVALNGWPDLGKGKATKRTSTNCRHQEFWGDHSQFYADAESVEENSFSWASTGPLGKFFVQHTGYRLSAFCFLFVSAS